MNSYYKNSRHEMLSFLPTNYKKVLEVGCARGFFRDGLNSDIEYWGIEIMPIEAEIAKKKLDKVLVGSYFDVYGDLPDGYFDLVICNDVIEHFVDHELFLNSLIPKMQKDGYLLGSVPNVRQYTNMYNLFFKRDWKYVDAGVLDRGHLRHFTEKSLKRFLCNSGFRIIKFKGINSVFRKDNILFRILRFIYYLPPVLFFGLDSRFAQFGFLVRFRN